ncbi:hypothetical protein HMPREF2943_07560 [Corynebacterium sp. HMSC072D12]|uniref:glycosyltransferase n=1 Tax=Corynebacterium sp. HMSC072D12 TaxID=1739447 RepID=UPI0008A1CC40|nr:glycosyltransferase [Corynebacterium sp. HMSC072D12]OFQ37367.1 hypothetical protein HMPREF2943_07560 [Corynebacterium sp. HMSC072D12]
MKIAFVVHELNIVKLLKEGADFSSPLEILKASAWQSRPNSTARLTLANVRAIKVLQSSFDIDFVVDTELTEQVKEVLSEFDLIIMNSVASVKSIAFTADLLDWKRQGGFSGKIIVGTEATWSGALKKGEITQEQYDSIYFGDGLLRHTARTDREIYSTSSCTQAAIQEFELAIDEDLFDETAHYDERNLITVVRAPEGRATKNNAGIDAFLSKAKESGLLDRYEIGELRPPYTVRDYWDVLAKSRYLIFTSMGETFSYALNDAKALGVVTFLPRQMYYTTVGRRFSVDSYPDVGIKYTSVDEVVRKIQDIDRVSSRWDSCSRRSKEVVRRKFSLPVITENWAALFSKQSLNCNSLFICAPGEFAGEREITEIAEQLDCSYGMEVYSPSWPSDLDSLSTSRSRTGVTLLRFYLTQLESGALRRLIEVDEGQVNLTARTALGREDMEQTLQFLQLIVRTYKVSKIVYTDGISSMAIAPLLKRLTYFKDIDAGVQSIELVPFIPNSL